jgi:hypothetical protein
MTAMYSAEISDCLRITRRNYTEDITLGGDCSGNLKPNIADVSVTQYGKLRSLFQM